MPTNVPPQYREAEERYRQASTIQAKIASLQEMLAIMPKHKGTDHLKAQLRSRLSRLMADLEQSSSKGKGSGRIEPFSMPKEGGGRATLIGPTNVGKSLLLNKSTGARSRVGAYELSTIEPVPGMLTYEDVPIQLVDTPPISNPSTQGRLYGLLRNTDVFIIVLDLSMDASEQAKDVFFALEQWGFRMLGRGEAPPEDDPWLNKPTIIVANKADIPGALDQYMVIEESFGDTYPVIMASAEENVGFDEMSEEVFEALKVIRVYTKSPRIKVEDYIPTEPLVLPIGATVMEAAQGVHKDISRGLKYAVLWGESGKFDGQRVGRAHQLRDRDIIELHT